MPRPVGDPRQRANGVGGLSQPAFVLPVARAIAVTPTAMGRIALRLSDPARLDDEIFRMELTRAEADNLARMIWGAVGLVMHRERTK